MLQLVIGIAIGAAVATTLNHAYIEREKQRLVDDIARLFEAERCGKNKR